MPDLHSRIAVEIERRLAVARAATPGPWRVCAEGGEGSRLAPDYGDIREKSRFIGIMNGRVQPEDGRNARFAALHDPADAERRYSAALRVLNRHARYIVPAGYGALSGKANCAVCNGHVFPCLEIADLRDSLGIADDD